MHRAKVDLWSGTYAEFRNESFGHSHVHVYMLYEQLDSGALRLYIGETMNEKRRIRQSLKRFPVRDATRIVLLLFSDEISEKTNRTYVEGRLYFALRRHPQINLLNHPRMVSASQCGIDPSFLAVAEQAVRLVMLHLAELGLHIFVPDILKDQNHEQNFEMLISHRGQVEYADAYHDQGKWIVRKGSVARHLKNGPNDDARHLRQRLIDAGLLRQFSDSLYRFEEDIAFSHANACASVINGKTACGSSRWLVRGHGMPLGDTGLNLRTRKGQVSRYTVRTKNLDSA